jgi:5'-nucleotidase
VGNKLKILVTNDDGVHSAGIKALAEAARPFGDVYVVAPAEGQSGMAHAITVKYPLRLIKMDEAPGYSVHKCYGTPVDCVKIAFDRVLNQRPDLIVSGINHGGNSAASVLYSGTMAAAIEGAINQVKAIGFSLLDFAPDANFSHAIPHVQTVIGQVLENDMPPGICLNVNIPRENGEELKGIRYCRQTRGYWIEEYEQRRDPYGGDYFWLAGAFNNMEPDAEDTDEWALKNNYISIVPVKADLTCYSYLEEMHKWKNQQ